MTDLYLIAIFLASGLSLVSYLYCWEDIKKGEPHIISLRQIMGIMDREKINLLLGEPKPGYYYLLPPPILKVLLSHRRAYFYTEIGADMACLAGAYLYMTGWLPAATMGWFIALAAICQLINFSHSLWLVRRFRHQIREELDSSRD